LLQLWIRHKRILANLDMAGDSNFISSEAKYKNVSERRKPFKAGEQYRQLLPAAVRSKYPAVPLLIMLMKRY